MYDFFYIFHILRVLPKTWKSSGSAYKLLIQKKPKIEIRSMVCQRYISLKWNKFYFSLFQGRIESSELSIIFQSLLLGMEKAMATHSSTLAWKSHGQRSLVGCCLWGRTESDTTEWLNFHFSCIGERNGNTLQCSCLENPRDGGAWWAAIYGVSQSQTPLKSLSSSSSSSSITWKASESWWN